eukprot:TRINITY_DN4315_c0_g2_i1.p1 TRINITY_DN4315_c0_g2~~TRINITY_DN4315_c0_g2_i1.p1  ORF type:complete len:276 (+),score=31.67 TRINITY_DN4315_c0_g2_i1:46-873(+)
MPPRSQRLALLVVFSIVFMQVLIMKGAFYRSKSGSEDGECSIPIRNRGVHYNETARFYKQMASTSEVKSSSLEMEKNGTAHLTHLTNPDIALVLKIDDLSKVIVKHVKRELPDFAYIQDPELYHITLLHLEEEHTKNNTVKKMLERMSINKVSIQLERVVVTSSGVVIALWQFRSPESEKRATDPFDLRQKLSSSLSAPISPLNPFILHTTLARFPSLQQFRHSRIDGARIASRLNRLLCGLSTDICSLWLVREYDKMALALHGRYDKQAFPLVC